MLRIASFAILGLTLVGADARAGQLADTARDDQPVVSPATNGDFVRLTVTVTKEVPVATTRPAALPLLYGGYASLQLLDGYQTTRGIAQGGHETNPMMMGFVSSPTAVWAIKAGSAALAIVAAERMWKTNKAGAVTIMIIANGLSAAVAARNASVLKQLRQP